MTIDAAYWRGADAPNFPERGSHRHLNARPPSARAADQADSAKIS
jgi:hypothetical protein